jgi:hypothetical protein
MAITHIAVQEKLDGKAINWMEKVTDEQYQAGSRIKRETKYIRLVYLVQNDMNAMSKKEADACVEESLAYDALRKAGHFVVAC